QQQQQQQQPQQQPQAPPQAGILPSDLSEMIPIQITLPNDPSGVQRSIQIQVPASCIHTNKLQEILTLPTIQATLSLPSELAAVNLQQQVMAALGQTTRHQANSVITQISRPASVITSQSQHQNQQRPLNPMVHLDGGAVGDSSDEEEEEDEEDDDFDDDVDDKDDEREDEQEDEGQDEITRSRNKWKFHLKDGIMNLNGKDYVFQKANGDAECTSIIIQIICVNCFVIATLRQCQPPHNQ
ncbi:unnamed protein product, partial [Allacma fusca]